jgi:phosphoenolpyruvate synthase/pyruvate phosphate dikinase
MEIWLKWTHILELLNYSDMPAPQIITREIMLQKVKDFAAIKNVIKQQGTRSPLFITPIMNLNLPLKKYGNVYFHSMIFTGKQDSATLYNYEEDYRDISWHTTCKALQLGDLKSLPELQDLQNIDIKTEALYKVYQAGLPHDPDLLENILRDSQDLFMQLVTASCFVGYINEQLIHRVIKQFDLKISEEEVLRELENIKFENFDERASRIVNQKYDDIREILWVFVDNQFLAPSIEEAETKLEEVKQKPYGNKPLTFDDFFAQQPITKEKFFIEFLKMTMWLRDWRKISWNKLMVVASENAKALCIQFGVPEKAAAMISYFDLMSYDNMGDIIRKAHLRLQHGYIMYASESEILEIHETDKDIAHILEPVHKKSTLTGQIGCRGFIKGRVRIILSIQDFGSFRTGEVLVTSMTRPEYVPLMKLACGIITDEGGITCHAAIISRELHKPCIIGTQNATRVLENGDIVEVDANTGTIKIL